MINTLFKVDHDEQEEGINIPIRNMVYVDLIDIVKQGHLDTISVWKVETLTKFTRVIDVLAQQIIGNMFYIKTPTALVNPP